jgi:hypothetical protein
MVYNIEPISGDFFTTPSVAPVAHGWRPPLGLHRPVKGAEFLAELWRFYQQNM